MARLTFFRFKEAVSRFAEGMGEGAVLVVRVRNS